MRKRYANSKVGRVFGTVRAYREGRVLPKDLYGGGKDDEAMAQILDGLDKLFAMLDLSEYRGVAAPTRATTRTLVLSERMILCHDEQVVGLTFRDPEGDVLPSWHPGSHLDLVLPSGRRRQYSLCGDPLEDDAYSIAVRLVPDGGGGSKEMHGLEVGTAIEVTGPRNAFPFVPRGRALFVAGGIGMTAIVPMVRRARAAGMDWHLVYCGRSRESMPFLDEVSTWEPEFVTVLTDDENGVPSGPTLLRDAPDGGSVYCCGPPPMIAAVRAEMSNTGATRLHYERFSPPPVVGGEPFTLELASTGEVLDVPADDTALEVVRRVLPNVPYSCRQGFCGTCRVRVLDGTPEHRDRRLDDAEREDHMLICVSRSEGGRLRLDL